MKISILLFLLFTTFSFAQNIRFEGIISVNGKAPLEMENVMAVNQAIKVSCSLPGLILEVNDGKTTILCLKVVVNLKEKVEIKAPTKGEKISQTKHDETVLKKMEEFKQMNQGQGGRNIRF